MGCARGIQKQEARCSTTIARPISRVRRTACRSGDATQCRPPSCSRREDPVSTVEAGISQRRSRRSTVRFRSATVAGDSRGPWSKQSGFLSESSVGRLCQDPRQRPRAVRCRGIIRFTGSLRAVGHLRSAPRARTSLSAACDYPVGGGFIQRCNLVGRATLDVETVIDPKRKHAPGAAVEKSTERTPRACNRDVSRRPLRPGTPEKAEDGTTYRDFALHREPASRLLRKRPEAFLAAHERTASASTAGALSRLRHRFTDERFTRNRRIPRRQV